MTRSNSEVSRHSIFWLVGGLYLLALSQGFGAALPPLSAPAILMATLTVIVMGHVLNLYTVVDAGQYDARCFTADLVILVGVSVGIGLLSHPAAAGSGNLREFITAWNDYEALLSTVQGGEVPQAKEAVLSSLQKFFAVSLVILTGLVIWHGAVSRGTEHSQLPPGGFTYYGVGWAVFLLVALIGLDMTGPAGPNIIGGDMLVADWPATYSDLWILALVSLGFAAGFIITIVHYNITWLKYPDRPIADSE